MDDQQQNRRDVEHLRLLAIFHYVSAGLALIGIAGIGAHYMIFRSIFMDPSMFPPSKGGPTPQEFFDIFKIFYVITTAWFVLTGLGNLLSAAFLRRRTNRTFSMVVAGFNCFYMPLGTVLGVLTFVVLGRDSVMRMYEENTRT